MVNKNDNSTLKKVKSPTNPSLKSDKSYQHLIYPAFLFIALLIIYLPSIKYDFVFDDMLFITDNSTVQKGVAGIGEIITHSATYGYNKINEGSYRPISQAIFALLYQKFPGNPMPFHLFNILCYAICILLLYRLLKIVLATYSENFIFIICLLFVVHPIHTEVVANIKSLDEILSLIFLLLCGLTLLKNIENYSNKNFILSNLFFLLALLSKESAVGFVFILPLIYYFFYHPSLKKLFSFFIVLCIPVIAYLSIRLSVLDYLGTETTPNIIDNILVSAKNFNEKSATSIFIVGQYAKLLFIPYPLSIDYSYNQIPIINWSNINAILALLFLFVSFVAGIILFLKNKIAGLAILFFFFSIAIVSHLFVGINATMAERFLFIPSLSACILIPSWIHNFRKNNSVTFSKYSFFLSILIALLFTIISISRVQVWKNNVTLFESGVKSAPKSARVYYLLGNIYLKKADDENDPFAKKQYFQQSLENSKKCIAIYPKHFEALENISHAYYFQEDYLTAIQYLKRTILINPNYQATNFFLSLSYENIGKNDSALFYNSIALKIDSTNNASLGRNGYLLYLNGDKEVDSIKRTVLYESALNAIEIAINHDPINVENYFYKGLVYVRQGKLAEAIIALKKIQELQPDEPRSLKLLGSVNGMMGNTQMAISYFKNYLLKNNNDPEAYYNLSLAYISLKDYLNANETLNAGLVLFPNEARMQQTKQMITGKQ